MLDRKDGESDATGDSTGSLVPVFYEFLRDSKISWTKSLRGQGVK